MKTFNVACRRRPRFDESHFDSHRQFISTEKVDFNGRAVNQACYVTDVPSERYKGLTVDDFALENLIAAGVELKPITLAVSEQKALDSIDSFIKSQKSDSNA